MPPATEVLEQQDRALRRVEGSREVPDVRRGGGDTGEIRRFLERCSGAGGEFRGAPARVELAFGVAPRAREHALHAQHPRPLFVVAAEEPATL
jgi:hypothetical protein